MNVQSGTHGAGSAVGSDAAVALAAARAALQRGRYDESAAFFAQLLSAPGYGAEGRYGLGFIELQQGSPERAAALFREATESDPRHANAWFALGHLAEPRSLEEAIRDYRRALIANPSHRGAADRLRALGHAPTATTPPATSAPEPGHASEPPAGGAEGFEHVAQNTHPVGVPASAPSPASDPTGPGQLGVVDFLRRDNNQVAKDALARIEALDRHRRFRVTARLQHLVVVSIVVIGLAEVIAHVLYQITPLQIGSTTIHFYSSGVTHVIVAAIVGCAAWSVWTLLNCVTNTVTIANGRIRWTRGVLNKHTETLDVWTARDIEFDRNLVQRLTRDGTLTFKGTLHDRPSRLHKGQSKPLRLTGIDHGADLEEIYALLLDLKFLLRAHQGVKGIIQ